MALKQAIIVRGDLGMSKGKMAGQTAHASVSAYSLTLARKEEDARQWEDEGQKKIVLKVQSEEELLALYERMKREMPCALIRCRKDAAGARHAHVLRSRPGRRGTHQ